MSKKNKNANGKKSNKNVWFRIFSILLLAVCAVAVVLIPFGSITEATETGVANDKLYSILMAERKLEGTMATLYTVAIYVFVAAIAVAAILSIFGLFAKKKKKSRNRVRFGFLVLSIGALVYSVIFALAYKNFNETAKFNFEAAFTLGSLTIDLFSAIIAVASLILFIIFSIRKREKKQKPSQAAQPENNGFHLEEYAEAYPYEGGPVAGVLLAQEVNPTFLPQQPRVNTAGYDFYNCKSFDPFIATLNDMERNAFTELFILKYSGTMPELPDYVVGGDNKEFFRKIFIYLGQYRDRIPQPLLTKMYQFSMKI